MKAKSPSVNKNNSEKFARAGYRVHFDRLKEIRAEISTIRTHKFKCEIPQGAQEELQKKFQEVSSVVDSSERGSGMWFLIQMIGVGFLFPAAENKSEALFNSLSGKIANYGFPVPNQEALKQILMTGYDNTRNIESALCDVWMVKEKELPPIANEIIFEIEKIMAENPNHKIGSKKSGLNRWVKEIFAKKLNCDKLLDVKKEGEGIEKLLIFNPKFIEWNKEKINLWIYNNEIDEISLYDNSYPWIFQNILPTISFLKQNKLEHLAKKPIDLITPYHALGKFLPIFRYDANELRKILNSQIPTSFEKKKDLINLLLEYIKNCAMSVSLATEKDFIAEDWAEYRETNFSGRLSGWLTNFQNRLKLFEETLSENGSHKLLFEKIEKNCDYKNILPEIQQINLRELKKIRADLAISFEVLQGKSNAKLEKDFGSLIEEYNQYLQDFREFLMRWNNEGIPNEIDGKQVNFFEKEQDKLASHFLNIKELCENNKKKTKSKKEDDEEGELKEGRFHKWSKSLLPKELDKYPRFIGCSKKDPKEEIEKARNELYPLISQAVKLAREINKLNKSDFDFNNEKWLCDKGKKSEKNGLGLLHKNLEIIKGLAARYSNEKELEKSKSFKFIEKYVDLEDTENDLNQKSNFQKELSSVKFFVSGYERRNNKFLRIKKIDFVNYLQDFEQHFKLKNKESAEDFQNWLGISQNELSFDSNEKGEILKIYLGLLLRNLPKEVILPQNFQDFDFLQNTALSSILFENGNLKTTKVEASLVQRFFAASVGSRIRSNISLLSRKEYIERNVISITSGSQSMLRYVALEWGAGDESINSNKIQQDLKNLEEQMNKLRGKNSLEFNRLKRKYRKLKLASRSRLEKLKKQLHHIKRDIENKKDSLNSKFIAELENRKKNIETKITKIEKKEDFGFSTKSLEILQKAEIDSKKSNFEIVKEIWQKFSKLENPSKRELAQVLAEIPHKWEAVLKTKQELSFLTPITEGFFIKKSKGAEIFEFCTPKRSENLYSFPIQTSVYQKQFLEKFLWGDKDGILSEKIMGASVILEETIKINSTEKSDFAMYVAIPFSFEKNEGDKDGLVLCEKRILENSTLELKNSEGKSQKQYRSEKNILGIDLGEYGFGWAVFNPETEKFLESGFMEISLLPKMRLEAAAWKDTQASGIFSRPTTYLAEIREQAAGQVRNQIHNLAIKHSAIPVYEDSVDGFESGGQRITKLYKTLKTSDVISAESNKADEAVREHFWGINFAAIGGVIGSSKTSQTCRCCGRCATSEISALEGDKVRIENNIIIGTDIFCKKENGEFDKKLIEAEVKKAQRVESEEEKIARELGKKKRGTVEQFQCQISSCKNKTDADAQAAQNIALKFYLRKFVATKEDEENPKFQTGKDNKKQFSSLKFFLEKSKEESYLVKYLDDN